MSTKIKEVSSSYCISTKFEWKINNFSEFIRMYTAYSDVFTVGRFKWQVLIYPRGVAKDHLSLYLCPVGLNEPVDAGLTFAVTCQTDSEKTARKELECKFLDGYHGCFGFPRFMRLNKLHHPAKGYIVDDTCVIQVEVTVDDEDPGCKCAKSNRKRTKGRNVDA